MSVLVGTCDAGCQVCLLSNQYFHDGICQDCPEAGDGIAVLIGIFIPLLFISGALYLLHGTRAPEFDPVALPLRRLVHNTKTVARQIGAVPKLKIALTFCQVIATLDSTYDIGLPDSW